MIGMITATGAFLLSSILALIGVELFSTIKWAEHIRLNPQRIEEEVHHPMSGDIRTSEYRAYRQRIAIPVNELHSGTSERRD